MKKIFFALVFFTVFQAFSQHEVKIDIGDALVIKTLEVGYENYLTEQTSIGASALFNFEKESADFKYNEKTMITPYVRHYFSATNTWNMFGELFFAYNKGEKVIDVNGVQAIQKYSDGALGVVVGYKYISPGGFTFDVHAGAGRNLFTKESPSVVPRVGVNVGFQF